MSYRDEVSFSMVAGNTVKECEGDQGEYSNVSTSDDGKRLLRTAAIYGANGSGKSAMIAAMKIFKTMVLRSFVDESIMEQLSNLYFHFDVESLDRPISMQMIFVCDGVRYRYGFEICHGEVQTEWLFVLSPCSTKESYCFRREGQNIKVNSKIVKGARGVDSKTRSNALYLSTAAQFNVASAMTIKEWFLKRFRILSGLDDTLLYTAKTFMTDPLLRQQIMQMLSIVDGCIKDVSIKEKRSTDKIDPQEFEIQATHNVFDNGQVVGNDSLNFKLESLGTTKLFALLGPFFDTIHHGGVLIIDEFGASLHTQLSIELLKMFYSPLNVGGAQLIVTTHDTNLLRKDLLRRDQIWFAEKSPEGISDLYSLVEYKINQANSVRNDASFSKDYLSGRYGAIPYFGNIEKFIMEYGGKKEQ